MQKLILRQLHFKTVCLDAEVWVVLVALDHAGLHPSSPALDENLWPVHGEQLNLLHLSDSPEENLHSVLAKHRPNVGRNWVDLGDIWWINRREPLHPGSWDL